MAMSRIVVDKECIAESFSALPKVLGNQGEPHFKGREVEVSKAISTPYALASDQPA